jgi:uncharacterized repeat protein (TIGR02543 family)
MRSGYVFAAWYKESAYLQRWDFAVDTVPGDITLYAKWFPDQQFTVTFNSQGGSVVQNASVYHSDTVPEPSDPTGTGTFWGWYREAQCLNRWHFSTDTVTADITLYAKWIDPQSLNMVVVSAENVSFQMGETGISPLQTVALSYDFCIDITEVTQGSYDAIMSGAFSSYTQPSWSVNGVDYPAYNVNWYDAALYCNARTKAENRTDTVYTYTSITDIPGNGCTLNGLSIDSTKGGYCLPTNAEWEFACRAGTTTNYYFDSTLIDNYAWHAGNSGSTPHLVAQKTQNDFGLLDMSGNVSEWCNTIVQSSNRALRGGNYASSPMDLRSASESSASPGSASPMNGFRVILPDR